MEFSRQVWRSSLNSPYLVSLVDHLLMRFQGQLRKLSSVEARFVLVEQSHDMLIVRRQSVTKLLELVGW